MSKLKSQEVNGANPAGLQQWNNPAAETEENTNGKSERTAKGIKTSKKSAK